MYVVSAFRRTVHEVRLKPDTTFYTESKTALTECAHSSAGAGSTSGAISCMFVSYPSAVRLKPDTTCCRHYVQARQNGSNPRVLLRGFVLSWPGGLVVVLRHVQDHP